MHDLAVIIVSTNEASWLPRCLTTLFERTGDGISVDVVIADNRSTDGTRELVERDFPQARVVTCENLGFSHANNVALKTCDARYVLFLNPDTETVEGTYADLVRLMDANPTVGLLGVPQINGDGGLAPSMRRFPTALRTLCEVLGAEWLGRRLPMLPPLGERDLRMGRYERESACDWTSGSFMFARREAIAAAGFLDERFFVFSEEIDFCLRIKRHGWEIRHTPVLRIIHHVGKSGIKPRRVAQDAYARLQYARKNFSPAHRLAFRAALALRYLTWMYPRGDADATRDRRQAAVKALRVLAGLDGSPYRPTPRVAVENGWPD
jgi:hypothetical protein